MQVEARVVNLDLTRRTRLKAPLRHVPWAPIASKRRDAAARACIVLGWSVAILCACVAFVLDLQIVHRGFGVEGLTLSLLLPPLTYLSMPWYVLLNETQVAPILLGYAAPLAGWMLVGLGRSLREDLPEASFPRVEGNVRRGKVIVFRPRGAMRWARPARRPAIVALRHGKTHG